MDSNWQLDGVNMNESSMRLISGENSTSVCQGNILDSSSMWDQTSGSQSLGFTSSNVHHNESSSSVLGDRLGSLGSLRDGFDSMSSLVWGSSPNDVLKVGGMFLPGPSGAFLPHFPADSGFIERAARYSCFSGGNLSAILSPFNANEASNTGLAPMQRSQEPFVQTGSQPVFVETIQNHEVNVPESSKRVCLSTEPRVPEGTLLKNERSSDGSGRSNNEAIMSIDNPNPDSEETGFSGQGDPVESESLVRSSSIGVGLKKRKRSVQDSELDRNTGFTEHQADFSKDQTSFEKKGKQSVSGKDSKQGPQASDSPKEEYLHVRARRGQATNSHSLAERVRREKISERMKFLQDLVPGCNKVTGKAVMLDEIINYVQSLQRQVEFLSMKLATVNPQIDCNLERLLTDDILQLRAGPSSSLSFQNDNMPMGLPFHQSHGIAQTSSIQGLGNHPDSIRRSMDLSLTATRAGFREPSSSHVNTSTTWGEELHNAIQMGLISTTQFSSHDISGSVPAAGHTKADI